MHTHARLILITLSLSLMFALFSTPTTAQRSPDCYEKVYGVVTIPIATGLPPITMKAETGRILKDECVEIADDRINHTDAAAPVAIYCTDEGVAVYRIDSRNRGKFGFLVTHEALEAFPADPTQNQLLVEDGGIQLYRLTSGELQLNTPPNWEGKIYESIWDGC